MSSNSLYDRDFHAWAQAQAELIRARRFDDLDVDNLADEVEGMGRSEKRELASRLAVLIAHLLKWEFQPGFRSRSWQLTIAEQRRQLTRHLAENPSLRAGLDEAARDAYGAAVAEAARETGLARFPAGLPYSCAQIENDSFLPED